MERRGTQAPMDLGQRIGMRPMRINRHSDLRAGDSGLRPVPAPGGPMAPDRDGDPDTAGFHPALDELRSALANLEHAIEGELTHMATCAHWDMLPICTCGLDGLNQYLGRKR